MKMGWDMCSSPPWVPFYPYTMFQNSISWPSHKKCRRTIITQKVLVTQSSNTVHCDWHTQKPICTDFQAFANTFHIFLILTGKKASKWLEWCIFRVWGMPNPMLQVSSLCNKRFLKITISGKNFTFCSFWLAKMLQNLGFEACRIQRHLSVSMISGSWKITILRDT